MTVSVLDLALLSVLTCRLTEIQITFLRFCFLIHVSKENIIIRIDLSTPYFTSKMLIDTKPKKHNNNAYSLNLLKFLSFSTNVVD